MQSSSGEPTRDRALTDLVLKASPDEFLILGHAYCEQIGRRTLNLSVSTLEGLLDQLNEVCTPYAYQHSEDTLLLVVQLLDKTSHVWMDPSVAVGLAGQTARSYCWRMVHRLNLRSQRSWRVIDAIIRFLDGYLTKDPSQELWTMPVEDCDVPDESQLPAAALPTLGNDDDIRIRFRVAATSPRLLTAGRLARRDLMLEVYRDIHKNLSTQQEKCVAPSHAVVGRLLTSVIQLREHTDPFVVFGQRGHFRRFCPARSILAPIRGRFLLDDLPSSPQGSAERYRGANGHRDALRFVQLLRLSIRIFHPPRSH